MVTLDRPVSPAEKMPSAFSSEKAVPLRALPFLFLFIYKIFIGVLLAFRCGFVKIVSTCHAFGIAMEKRYTDELARQIGT